MPVQCKECCWRIVNMIEILFRFVCWLFIYIFFGNGVCDCVECNKTIWCLSKHIQIPYAIPGNCQLHLHHAHKNENEDVLVSLLNRERVTLSEFTNSNAETMADYYVYLISNLLRNANVASSKKIARGGYTKIITIALILFIIIYTKVYPFEYSYLNKMLIICSICIPLLYAVSMTMLGCYMMKYAKNSCFFLTNIGLFRVVSRIHWKRHFNIEIDNNEQLFYDNVMNSTLFILFMPVYKSSEYNVDMKPPESYEIIEKLLNSRVFVSVKINIELPLTSLDYTKIAV